MKKAFFYLQSAALLLVVLESCISISQSESTIPGPAKHVKAKDALAIAHRYASMKWTPSRANIRHGLDHRGIEIHTPDQTLSQIGDTRGSWSPGVEQIGMPYQWGGFDTPKSFSKSITRGKAAGDIATPGKRSGGDDAVSQEACGIDCSGFVSRCWRLKRPYSTAELPTITRAISWEELLPGDILLNDRHVLLFAGWKHTASAILAYEAGPFPAWKVSANAIPTELLLQQQYRPRRYHHIIHPSP
ncbi:MAG: hypothetical protein RLZZ553_1097 [Verrucomicrobiota bacterium]|jgi:hypothetical protein